MKNRVSFIAPLTLIAVGNAFDHRVARTWLGPLAVCPRLTRRMPRRGCEVLAVWEGSRDPMLAVGRFGNGAGWRSRDANQAEKRLRSKSGSEDEFRAGVKQWFVD